MPGDIVSDRDSRFTGEPWTSFCKDNQIYQSLRSAYHPRTDGQTEVANKAVIQHIRARNYEGNSNWRAYLPSIQAILNRTRDSSRRATPFEIAFGHNPRLIGDMVKPAPDEPETTDMRIHKIQTKRQHVRTNLANAKLDQSLQTNKRRRKAPEFQVGDQVLLSTRNLPLATAYPKTATEYAGPFTITQAFPQTDNYTLELPEQYNRLHPTFRVESLKKYIPNDDKKFPYRQNSEPGPLAIPEFEDEELYEVEQILTSRNKPKTGIIEYKVKWKG